MRSMDLRVWLKALHKSISLRMVRGRPYWMHVKHFVYLSQQLLPWSVRISFGTPTRENRCTSSSALHPASTNLRGIASGYLVASHRPQGCIVSQNDWGSGPTMSLEGFLHHWQRNERCTTHPPGRSAWALAIASWVGFSLPSPLHGRI